MRHCQSPVRLNNKARSNSSKPTRSSHEVVQVRLEDVEDRRQEVAEVRRRPEADQHGLPRDVEDRPRSRVHGRRSRRRSQ